MSCCLSGGIVQCICSRLYASPGVLLFKITSTERTSLDLATFGREIIRIHSETGDRQYMKALDQVYPEQFEISFGKEDTIIYFDRKSSILM